MRLAQNYHDLFDEVMHCGEDLRTAFECYSRDNHNREHEPGHEADHGSIAYQQARISGGEFYQTSHSDFHAGRIIVAEKSGDGRGNHLPISRRNHPGYAHQR